MKNLADIQNTLERVDKLIATGNYFSHLNCLAAAQEEEARAFASAVNTLQQGIDAQQRSTESAVQSFRSRLGVAREELTEFKKAMMQENQLPRGEGALVLAVGGVVSTLLGVGTLVLLDQIMGVNITLSSIGMAVVWIGSLIAIMDLWRYHKISHLEALIDRIEQESNFALAPLKENQRRLEDALARVRRKEYM